MLRRVLLVTFAAPLALTASLSAGPTVADDGPSARPVAVQQVGVRPHLRDEAAMVLVGTALIALAAAVRRV